MRQAILSLLLSATLSTFAVDKMANVVCFVQFADQTSDTWKHDFDYYEKMFNDDSDGANSVKNYFHDAGYGRMDWTSTIVRTIYVDSRNRTQLCKQSSVAPDGYTNSVIASMLLEPAFVGDICKGIESSIPDDAVIDCDGDGIVDNLTLIICGNSEISSSHLLWPSNNKASLSTASIKGKRIGNYLKVFDGANGYKNLRPQEINTGVLCHEMMHTLNAYDLYSSSSSVNPVGVWDLMSDNQIEPQGMTAYMRKTYGGWIEEIRQIYESGEYVVAPIESATSENVAFKIVPNASSQEYFVVEYRSKDSRWDKNLPYGGLLVYRVNELAQGNLGGQNSELYVFRPGGTDGKDGVIAKAPLGPSTGRLSFGSDGDEDYPFYSDGSRAAFSISDVKVVDGGMQFRLSLESASIDDSIVDDEMPFYDPESGSVIAPGAVSVEVFSIAGIRVDSMADAVPGIYIVRAQYPSGVKTLKITK